MSDMLLWKYWKTEKYWESLIATLVGSKGVAVVRALASHQCGPGSSPGVGAICGLGLFLVLTFPPRGFSLGTLVFPSPQKPISDKKDIFKKEK